MSTAWVPPRRSFHLRVFVISLVLVVAALVVFLFAVRLEAIVPAKAVIQGRDQQDVRAPLGGLVELGWYEGEIQRSSGQNLRVRLDDQGAGTTDSTQGEVQIFQKYKLPDGQEIRLDRLKFHKLEAGDLLWPDQVLARIRADDLHLKLKRLEARLAELQKNGGLAQEVRTHINGLRERLAQATIRVPGETHWLVLKVHPSAMQAVAAGDAMALLTPVDRETGKPRELVAHLEILEKHASEVRVGQKIRLYSTMFGQRLHGHAEGVLERLDPVAHGQTHGERVIQARATITYSPFPLVPGSSCRVEIIIGPKQVYSIILEQ